MNKIRNLIYTNLIMLSLFFSQLFAQNQIKISPVVYMQNSSIVAPYLNGLTGFFSYLSPMLQVDDDSGIHVNFVYIRGGIIRTDTTQKEIHLVFTGHEYADGLETVMKVLKKHHIKGSFFFTGDFYRNAEFKTDIEKLKDDGNYLGAHSDKHLLYASWTDRDSTLVTKEKFFNDLDSNYKAMEKFGITKKDANYFLPPFEWYNSDIADWCKAIWFDSH